MFKFLDNVSNVNKKISIGIISGAGPMAGIQLMTAIIKRCQKKGVYHDRDFPRIHLLNIPFSEMLEGEIDAAQIEKEIQAGFDALKQCTYIVIACQTAHLFLPKELPPTFINLITLIKEQLPIHSKPVVIASRTSANNDLHTKLLGMRCEYYDAEESQKVIDKILRGKPVDLTWINELDSNASIILGCTEYSIPQNDTTFNANVIDPIRTVAEYLTNLFLQRESINMVKQSIESLDG